MMKEGVIIKTISIKRQGERKHFQIKLPKDTKFIIGVEYGGRLISRTEGTVEAPAPKTEAKTDAKLIEAIYSAVESGAVRDEKPKALFKRNQLIGELKLQSCEEANWFYAADVFANDANLNWGDFSQAGFPVNDFTHGNKRTEEIVKVDAESTIINGWYLDALGKTLKLDINYEIKVYVWINVEE
jgi:hypothetical protein